MGSVFRGRNLGPQPLHKARTYVGEFECVQAQMAGQFFAGENAAHTISLGIQARRIHRYSQLAIHDGNEAAANAALGWKAYPVGPFAGMIVPPAGRYQRQRVLNVGFVPRGTLRLAGVGLSRAFVELPQGTEFG